MFIKVCGITTKETALAVAEAGADMIGFVFAPSSRKIEPEAAAQLAKSLPASLQKVGVFVNESQENIEHIAEIVGLDYVQLHGDEDVAFAQNLSRPIIKAFSVNTLQADEVKNYPATYTLIDSPGVKYRGGSGNTFDWQQLFKHKLNHEKLILAGGLNIDNVGEAIKMVRPAGIDVSSGVETNGIKDIEKIYQFVAEAVKYK